MERDFWIGLKSDADKGVEKKESNGVYIGKYGYLNLEDKANAIQSFDKATAGLRKFPGFK